MTEGQEYAKRASIGPESYQPHAAPGRGIAAGSDLQRAPGAKEVLDQANKVLHNCIGNADDILNKLTGGGCQPREASPEPCSISGMSQAILEQSSVLHEGLLAIQRTL